MAGEIWANAHYRCFDRRRNPRRNGKQCPQHLRSHSLRDVAPHLPQRGPRSQAQVPDLHAILEERSGRCNRTISKSQHLGAQRRGSHPGSAQRAELAAQRADAGLEDTKVAYPRRSKSKAHMKELETKRPMWRRPRSSSLFCTGIGAPRLQQILDGN